MSRKNITTKEHANEWLSSNFPNYEVIEWGGSGQSKDTIILDKNKNFKFSYSFMRFKDKLQRYPDREFGLSKKEVASKARNCMIKKYGVQSPLQVKEFLEKAKESIRRNYGTDNVMKNEEFVDSFKKNLNEKIWGNNEIRSDIIKRRKETRNKNNE